MKLTPFQELVSVFGIDFALQFCARYSGRDRCFFIPQVKDADLSSKFQEVVKTYHTTQSLKVTSEQLGLDVKTVIDVLEATDTFSLGVQ